MANYHEDIVNIELENGNIHRTFLNHSIGAGDNSANRFGVKLFRNGVPENVSGSCFGLFIRADGQTVTINNGTVTGNTAYVTLPEACYVVEGQFCLTIKVSGTGNAVTLRIVDGVVSRTSTNVLVDPGTVIPSIEDLIEEIEAAVESIPADYSSLWASIAPAFNPSKPGGYKEGEYVTYNDGTNGKMYRFISNHSGSWSASDVVAVDVGEEFKNVKNETYINKGFFASGNLNDITDNSIHQIKTEDAANIQNLPKQTACTVITNRFDTSNSAYVTQLCVTYDTGEVYYRKKYSSWSSWVHLTDFNNKGLFTGDLNDITDNVVRTVASGGTRPTHFPSAFGTEAAVVVTAQIAPGDTDFLVQMCISYTTGRILIRNKYSSTWSEWGVPVAFDNVMVVKGSLASSNDVDDITGNAIYGVQASSNYPANYPMKNSPGVLLSSKIYGISGYGVQFGIPYNFDVNSDPYRYQNGLYARRLYNSEWMDWAFYKLTPRNHAGKYFAFGDSTTWGYSSDNNHAQSPWNYPAIVGDLIGCEVHNVADPGQGLIKNWNTATSSDAAIIPTIESMVENGDFDDTVLITVGWAYNDGSYYSSLNFGSPTDPIPASNTGITTFLGYYARILAVLQEAAPGAMVMLVTGYGTPWDNEGHKGDILFSYEYTFADGQKSTKEMYDALEQMANYYGFYCVNQAKGGVINRISANYIIGDNIHPSYDTYRIYGNFVASRIASAFQNV